MPAAGPKTAIPTPVSESLAPRKIWMGLGERERGSQARAVASSEAETTTEVVPLPPPPSPPLFPLAPPLPLPPPLSKRHTPPTAAPCPRHFLMTAPVATSHQATPRSPEPPPEARRAESAEAARQRTPSSEEAAAWPPV